MMRLAVCLFMLLVGLGVNAQYQFVKQWDYRWGGYESEVLTCFRITKENGFILGGWSRSDISGDKTQAPWGGADYWVVKLDSNGNKLWDRRYGTTGGDYLRSIYQTHDSGFVFTGDVGGAVNGDKTELSKGGSDYWMLKIDVSGNVQWDKTLGGSGGDYALSAVQTVDNGYLVGGFSWSDVSGDKTQPCWDTTTIFQPYSDYWIVKTDSVGNKEWDKRYGGVHIESFYCLIQTIDHGYLLAGRSLSDSSGDKTQDNWPIGLGDSYDGWLVKIDSLGNKEWDKRFGGSGVDGIGRIFQIEDGGYIVAGYTTSPLDGDKTTDKKGFWLFKIDAWGNKVWEKVYDGGAIMYNMEITSDKGYLFSGQNEYFIAGVDKSESNLGEFQSWVIKTDSMGNKEWDKTIFTNNSQGGIALQTKDGCYAIANTTYGNIGGYKTEPSWGIAGDSSEDYWILKFCMERFSGIEQTPKSPSRNDRDEKGDLNSRIQVWPNPFSTDVSIALTGSYTSTATFTITSITGQVVYQQQESNLAPGYTKMLELSYLPNGVYFIEVSTAAGKAVQRVVKE